MPEQLKSDVLSDLGVAHGFFTRNGGVSVAPFASLNCAYASNDVPDSVSENRRRIARSLSENVTSICTNSQVHGSRVTLVRNNWQDATVPEGDALVTREAGYALSILTADCVPVLLAERDAGIIGAAHAGWKGALAGVVEATVSAMEQLGARRQKIVAATGPAIQQSSYEVGPEVREAFAAADEETGRFFLPSENAGHFQFDLPQMVVSRLEAAGIEHMDAFKADTYEEKDLFFSYRRSTHARESDYGRMLSSIILD